MNLKSEISHILKIVKLYEEWGPPYAHPHIDISDKEQCELALNTVEELFRFASLFRDSVKCERCKFHCKLGNGEHCSDFQTN